MFNLHQENIEQIKATIEAFGICYFHGDGNFYENEQDSNFRKDFSNPKNDNATYRVLYDDVADVPADIEGLSKDLLASRNKEVIEASKPKTVAVGKTITVSKKSAETASAVTSDDSGNTTTGDAATSGADTATGKVKK